MNTGNFSFHLKVENLTKYYTITKKKALDSVSLELPGPSESGTAFSFALLGPNGAGKTTLLKCLLNLTNFQEGKILLNNLPVTNEHSRRDLCFLPEKFSFYPFYTVNEAIDMMIGLFGRSKTQAKDDKERAIELLKISELLPQKIKNLSKGQQQRVGLTRLFLSGAHLLILDEPFSGLDPIGIKDLKDIMVLLKKEGRSFIINSHILSELEKMADVFAILNRGRLLHFDRVENAVKGEGLENLFYRLIETDESLQKKRS